MSAPRCCSGCEDEVGDKGFLDDDGLCADCTETHRGCYRCGEMAPEDEVDDDCVCSDCRQADEDHRQLESDYRYWTAGL